MSDGEQEMTGGDETPPQIDVDALLAENDRLKEALTDAEANGERQADVIGTLQGERDRLKEALTDAERERDAAVKAQRSNPAIGKAPKGNRPRKLGPVKQAIGADALLDLLKAGPHVLAFSDGESEIMALEPLTVEPDAWEITRRGVRLKPIKLVVSPDRRVLLAGVAVLDADGKRQIGWAAMATPIAIEARQKVLLDGQVIL